MLEIPWKHMDTWNIYGNMGDHLSNYNELQWSSMSYNEPHYIYICIYMYIYTYIYHRCAHRTHINISESNLYSHIVYYSIYIYFFLSIPSWKLQRLSSEVNGSDLLAPRRSRPSRLDGWDAVEIWGFGRKTRGISTWILPWDFYMSIAPLYGCDGDFGEDLLMV